MLTPLSFRIHTALERIFPEQRLYLKSDEDTRFVRLRSGTQAISVVLGTLALAWTIVATAVLMMDSIGSGSGREQMQRQQALYETRLNNLSTDRDLRADEAARAQERFNTALKQVSQMQVRLLASEDRRREMETGIDVVQATLRRTIRERDEARAAQATMASALDAEAGEATEMGRARDTVATLEFLTTALGDTARHRDDLADAAAAAEDEVALITEAKALLEARNEVIFTQLEEAITVSMEPLDSVFRSVGLAPDDLIASVRRGYSGQGGPLSPISLSNSGSAPSPEEVRANAILQGLDRLNLYRLAAFKTPLAMPVKDRFRWTSGFGVRNDPHGRGRRMHEGSDMAGSLGTPIYATADGVVVHAGWEDGYGKLVRIRHDFGLETRYGHLSQVRVEVGQKVSRGEQIGDMGSTGRSTGTHLHYEVRVNGTAVNPMTFIKAGKNVF